MQTKTAGQYNSPATVVTKTRIPGRSAALAVLLLFAITAQGQRKPDPPLDASQMDTPASAVFTALPSTGPGVFSPVQANPAPWLTHIRPLERRHAFLPGVDSLKGVANRQKRRLKPAGDEETVAGTGFPAPAGTGFQGNPFNGGAPPDNSIAVSATGWVVSAINANVAYYDSRGTLFWLGSFWEIFRDPELNRIIYDPIVQYDPVSDRFILICVHGFSSDVSRVLIAFSKTANPNDGWWTYKLAGDALGNRCWLDFPKLGISPDELFITGDLYQDDAGYRESIIFQIGKADGYAGRALNTRVWSGIPGRPISLVPVSYGLASNFRQGMYFLNQGPASGSSVELFEISTGRNQNPTLTRKSIPKQDYRTAGYAQQPGTDVELITGDCRISNAFLHNGIIHYVFQENYRATGFTGVSYNRLNVQSLIHSTISYGRSGADLAYPAVALWNAASAEVAVVFQISSASLFPETRVVFYNPQSGWSDETTLRKGDTYVDAFAFENTVRWGDYSGITFVERENGFSVWAAGSFGTTQNLFETPYRCFVTWLARFDRVTTRAAMESPDPVTLMAYPNPAIDLVSLEFSAGTAGPVTIAVYDLTGRLVQTLYDGTLRSGKNLLVFNRRALASGTYLVTVREGAKLLKTQQIRVL